MVQSPEKAAVPVNFGLEFRQHRLSITGVFLQNRYHHIAPVPGAARIPDAVELHVPLGDGSVGRAVERSPLIIVVEIQIDFIDIFFFCAMFVSNSWLML